jgi:hypothetical protein
MHHATNAHRPFANGGLGRPFGIRLAELSTKSFDAFHFLPPPAPGAIPGTTAFKGFCREGVAAAAAAGCIFAAFEKAVPAWPLMGSGKDPGVPKGMLLFV